MRKFNGWIMLVLLLALVAGLTLAVWAGPVLDKPRIPDELRSLAGMTKFRIQVDPIIGLSEKEVPSRDDLARLLGEDLERPGFEIGNEPHLPRLVLQVMVAKDSDQPDAVGLAMVLAVHQEAYFERLDRALTVPTASMSSAGLTVRRRAQETIRDMTRRMAVNMAAALRLAERSVPPVEDADER